MNKDWVYGAVLIVSLIAIALLSVAVGHCQTPPVVIFQALPDTVRADSLTVAFTVEAETEWNEGGGVGFYYRTPDLSATWNYAATISGATESPVTWFPPFAGERYEFAGQVTDNNGTDGLYPHDRGDFIPEAVTFYCPGCPAPDDSDCPDCPGVTLLLAVSVLAENGITTWGLATEPKVRYYWTHPTTGTPVARYFAEWRVDTLITEIDNIAVGDTTVAFIDVPYTPGKTQSLRVKGIDDAERAGVFSFWAVDWLDDGPPGETGEVMRTLYLNDPNN